MTDIIERVESYSNDMMVEYCHQLKSVLTQTKQTKKGRGKDIKIVQSNKYAHDPETMSKIDNSIEYYSKKTEKNFSFRDYQLDIINSGCEILKRSRFLYLAMEVRTGKTLTSIGIAEKMGVKNVLFVTKKKAIDSIESDYKMYAPDFLMIVINYESLHLVMNDKRWDMIILDEAHSMGAFPKPSQRALLVSDVIRRCNPMVMLLSGTPTPESYSQMYHQVYAIPNNPFKEFKNFYRFCDVYVKVKEKRMNGLVIKDYSNGLSSILDMMRPYTINYTQKEAGFSAETHENILYVDMKESTYKLIDRLKSDLVIEGKEEVILADTPVKLMMKMHQLYSGTIKFESGNSMIIDTSKAEFIKERFKDNKIGIFYKFKEELNALKNIFGDDLTTELNVFENTNKSIALQIVSGREGISLKQADFLVYYNIDFSATSYWQSKDRMTTKDRLENTVYWIFSRDGIEDDIYKAVTKKKDFTINHFKKFLL